jgi:glycosyltransferase involved in cell wall biosynthesis
MRIGIVTGEFAPMQGGVGDFTRELSTALAALDQQVFILAPAGCTWETPPAGVALQATVEQWNWSLANTLRRWVRQERLDAVNLQYQAAAYGMHPALNLLPGTLAGVPLVATLHDLKVPYLFPKAGRLRWWAVRRLAQRAAGVIVTNREDLLRLQGEGFTGRLALIPIGSNIAATPPPDYDRAAWRAQWGVSPDEILLGYFGFLNESKGGEELVEALYTLQEAGVPAKLMMIGGRTGSSDTTNQAYADRIDALIAQRQVGDRVLRTGYVPAEDVSAALLAVDACVLPYRDGISFRRGSLMAALAHGRPVITTEPPVELPELKPGENVYLVPPHDPPALSAAVIALWEDPVLAARLATGAQALAQNFGWDAIAQATAGLFERLRAGDLRGRPGR